MGWIHDFGVTDGIPGLMSLCEAIERVLRSEPGGVAIAAELSTVGEAFEVTIYRVAEHELVNLYVDGATGEVTVGGSKRVDVPSPPDR